MDFLSIGRGDTKFDIFNDSGRLFFLGQFYGLNHSKEEKFWIKMRSITMGINDVIILRTDYCRLAITNINRAKMMTIVTG